MSVRLKKAASAAAGSAAGVPPARRPAVPSASAAKSKSPTQSKGTGLTLADLPDVEKEKVSRLVHKLIDLGQEHELTLAALAAERAKYEQHVSSTNDTVDTVGEQISVVEERLKAKDLEISELDARSTMMTGLLALYQAKLKNSGDLLRYHSAAEEEGKIRAKQLESDLCSLQSLVGSQKETIESFQNVGSSYNSSLADLQREHEAAQAGLVQQVAQLQAQLQGVNGSVASAQMSEQLLKEKLVAAEERHAVLTLQCDLLRQNLDLQSQMQTQAQAQVQTQAQRQTQAQWRSENNAAELISAPEGYSAESTRSVLGMGAEEEDADGVIGADVDVGPSSTADLEYAQMYTSVDSISFSFQPQAQGVDDAGHTVGVGNWRGGGGAEAVPVMPVVPVVPVVQVMSTPAEKQKRPINSRRVAAAVAALPLEVAQLGARMRQMKAAQAMSMMMSASASASMAMSTASADPDLSSIRATPAPEASDAPDVDLPAVSDDLLLRSYRPYDDPHAWKGVQGALPQDISVRIGRLDLSDYAGSVLLPQVAVEPVGVVGRGSVSVGGVVDVSDVSERGSPLGGAEAKEQEQELSQQGTQAKGRKKDAVDVKSKGKGKARSRASSDEAAGVGAGPKKRKAAERSQAAAHAAAPTPDAVGQKRLEGKRAGARGKAAAERVAPARNVTRNGGDQVEQAQSQAGSHGRPLSAPTRSSEVKGAHGAHGAHGAGRATPAPAAPAASARDSHSTFDPGHRSSGSRATEVARSLSSSTGSLKALGSLLRPTRSTAARGDGGGEEGASVRRSRDGIASGQSGQRRGPSHPDQQSWELQLDESFFDLLGEMDPLHADAAEFADAADVADVADVAESNQ